MQTAISGSPVYGGCVMGERLGRSTTSILPRDELAIAPSASRALTPT